MGVDGMVEVCSFRDVFGCHGPDELVYGMVERTPGATVDQYDMDGVRAAFLEEVADAAATAGCLLDRAPDGSHLGFYGPPGTDADRLRDAVGWVDLVPIFEVYERAVRWRRPQRGARMHATEVVYSAESWRSYDFIVDVLDEASDCGDRPKEAELPAEFGGPLVCKAFPTDDVFDFWVDYEKAWVDCVEAEEEIMSMGYACPACDFYSGDLLADILRYAGWLAEEVSRLEALTDGAAVLCGDDSLTLSRSGNGTYFVEDAHEPRTDSVREVDRSEARSMLMAMEGPEAARQEFGE